MKDRRIVEFSERVITCRKCPELRQYCAEVARVRRRAFADEEYWGRPIPPFGADDARIMVIGLAPAAHGANRTGRPFTGDASGDFLFAALHRTGFANQPNSTDCNDGMRLRGVSIAAAVRCAPPDNRPTPQEQANCRTWLIEELGIRRPRVLLALGAIAWNASLLALCEAMSGGPPGEPVVMPRPRPRFGHGAECVLGDVTLLGAYHPSPRNTYSGRLTAPMLDAVLRRAGALASA